MEQTKIALLNEAGLTVRGITPAADGCDGEIQLDNRFHIQVGRGYYILCREHGTTDDDWSLEFIAEFDRFAPCVLRAKREVSAACKSEEEKR